MAGTACLSANRLKNFRKAYTLDEAAELCMTSRFAIKDIATEGEIALHVWVPLMVFEESCEVEHHGKVLFETKRYQFEGYMQLFASDIRKLVKYEQVNIRCFACGSPRCRILLIEGTPDVEVHKKDIRILKDDLIALQKLLGIEQRKVDSVRMVGRLDDLLQKRDRILKDRKNPARCRTTFDPLFQSITFNGQNFSFGLIQASIIKQLYEAQKNGHPRVHFKTLLENANANCMYMRDVFKSQDNWRDIICSDKKGYYWLHDDFCEAA